MGLGTSIAGGLAHLGTIQGLLQFYGLVTVWYLIFSITGCGQTFLMPQPTVPRIT
jgi:hypothetical protein